MQKYLTALGILGLTLAMVGVLGSVAWAQGPPGVTAEAAELETTGDQNLAEESGAGLAAVASLASGISIWGVEVENLDFITEYNLQNQNEAVCLAVVDFAIVTFTTGPTGAAAASDVTTNPVEEFVIICQGTRAVLSGELFDVNQAVRGRGRP